MKKQGCIGVIAEIVQNTSEGRLTTPEELCILSEACYTNDLIFAMDETMTALRCGAPFAHQRPEYRKSKPDLIFFGKALNVNGIGINFDAPYLSRLKISTSLRRKQAVYDWQATVTRALHMPVLIDAVGVLEMAIAGNWVSRSKIIGQHLRQIAMQRAQELDIIDNEKETELVGGLESLLFVHKTISKTFLVMGALTAGPREGWVRWLPRMDKHLTDKSILESIMLTGEVKKRRRISEYLEQEGSKPQWCFYCGTWARNIYYRWCRTCCIDCCDAEECSRRLLAHECLV